MKLFMCSVFDVKVNAYMTPFFVRSRGEALRSFEDACRDEKHNFFRHPEDYLLYVIAEFDDSVASVVSLDRHLLCGASDFVVRPANGSG